MNKKGTTHMTLAQRLQLKQLLDAGVRKSEIASALGKCERTIYHEIKRGTVDGAYDPYCADEQYRQTLQDKGPDPVLSADRELASYISHLILHEGKSPEQIVQTLRQSRGSKLAAISRNTIYAAIDKGYIPGVTRDSLRSHTATVFSGGQICIARWVRDELGIEDGDVLHVEIDGDQLIFTKAGTGE